MFGCQRRTVCISSKRRLVGVDENYTSIMLPLIENVDDGASRLITQASSGCAIFWGASYTHVHADNVAARRLYHSYGFRAPKGR